MVGVSVSVFAVLVLIFFFLFIPILVGVYVYRDATQRGMNALVWTLVAVLAPSLIGLIIYLIVRSSYSNLSCPSCGTAVREDFCTCPSCGTKLKASCISCGYPIEPGWTVCPKCSAPIDLETASVTAPIQKKDKGLKGILIAVLIIPIMLVVLIVFALMAYRVNTSSGVHHQEYVVTEKSEDILD